MAWPVTINGHTYTENHFAPYAYTVNFPLVLQDVADVAGQVQSAKDTAVSAAGTATTKAGEATSAASTATTKAGEAASSAASAAATVSSKVSKAGDTMTGALSTPFLHVAEAGFDTGYKGAATFVVHNNAGRTDYTRCSIFQNATGSMGIEVADQTNARKLLMLQPYGGNIALGTTGSNVGVGITVPSASLHVYGAVANVASGYFPAAYIGRPLDIGGNRSLEIGNYGYTTYLQTTDTGSNIGDLILNPRGGDVFAGGPLISFTDNAHALGRPSSRWSVVYAGTGTINTSDAREKTAVRALLASERAAAIDLSREVGVYQWLASIAEKGEDGARLHIGLTVQRAIEIMETHGLDPWRFGFICRDEIVKRVKVTKTQTVQATEEVEEAYTEIEIRDGVPVQVQKTRTVQRGLVEMVAVVDEDGEPVMRAVLPAEEGGEPGFEPVLHPVPVMVEQEIEVEEERPDGDRLGFRYDQLTLFILAGLSAQAE